MEPRPRLRSPRVQGKIDSVRQCCLALQEGYGKRPSSKGNGNFLCLIIGASFAVSGIPIPDCHLQMVGLDPQQSIA